MDQSIAKQIHLPLREAVKISARSIRSRFGRACITTGGIFLGIAFLMSVVTWTQVEAAVGETFDATARARQVWMITISLLVCVLGVVNSMLMAVTERYKEIGTMKCLGALNRFIVEIFLLESAFMGLVGSALGAVIGWGVITLVELAKHGSRVLALYPWGSVTAAALLAAALGVTLSVLGAVYPAYRASRMVPADAMRVEI